MSGISQDFADSVLLKTFALSLPFCVSSDPLSSLLRLQAAASSAYSALDLAYYRLTSKTLHQILAIVSALAAYQG